MAYGVASGDIGPHRAIVWSCTDRPSRMQVEWATKESFEDAGQLAGPVARAENGYTARAELIDLPASQRIFYRVYFEDLSDSRNISLPAVGSFLSAPGFPSEREPARDLSFAWSADTVGQGWGINTAWGGLRIYEAIRRARPDFFIHCGDTIYADGPLAPEVTLPDGTIWKNVVTPAKSKVAETLDEFRGNHLYNMLDENVRRFNADVPQVVLWDDHEVRNNWYPQQTIQNDDRYTIKSLATLSARARQAFLEHTPIRIVKGAGTVPEIFRRVAYGPMLDVFTLDLRTYRGPNSPNRQTSSSAESAMAGRKQIVWLEQSLLKSRATWKVIASDMPIGLIVRDGDKNFEAFANGDGPPLGRELELARLLRFIHRRKIQNVIWVTADVHYAAAHRYDPERAQFKEFAPFWEFVAGPLHAGTGRPSQLDNTFGPEVRFNSVPATLPANLGPAAGFQFFGMVNIAASTGVMTVSLHNISGDRIYSVDLDPHRPL
jgi:alkaline phosphatase D